MELNTLATLLIGLGLVPFVVTLRCFCCGTNQCGTGTANCTPFSAPASVTLQVSGVGGTTHPCISGITTCAGLNATFVLTTFTETASSCTWTGPTCTVGGGGQISVGIQGVGGQVVIRVRINSGALLEDLTWESAGLGAPVIDCSGLGTVACSPVGDTSPNCNNAGSAASVTF